jgi:hypothetical protein
LPVAFLVAIGYVMSADRYAYLPDGRPKFEVGFVWLSVEGTILGTLAGGFASILVCGAVALVRRLKKHEDTTP